MKDESLSPSTALVPVAKALLPVYFHLRHRDTKIEIVGDGAQKLRNLRGKRTVICLNHPHHDDADIIFAVSRISREDYYFLAAREIIYGCEPYKRLLKYLGCLPVDRGGSNVEALIAARNLLTEQPAKLVVFPEGEVSSLNDTLLPLKTGAARIAFSVLQELAKRGDRLSPVLILPVALKYTYEGNIVETLKSSVSALEKHLGIKRGPDSYVCLYDRIYEIADILLARLALEYNINLVPGGNLSKSVDFLRETILEQSADLLEMRVSSRISTVDRLHKLQSEYIRQKEQARNQDIDPTPKDAIVLADRMSRIERNLGRLVTFLSIYDEYLTNPASQERYAEIISIFERELLGEASNKGAKVIYLAVGEPIDLADSFSDFLKDKQAVVAEITSQVVEQLTSMIKGLDEMREPIMLEHD